MDFRVDLPSAKLSGGMSGFKYPFCHCYSSFLIVDEYGLVQVGVVMDKACLPSLRW